MSKKSNGNKKPSILLVTENLNVGGAEKYTVLIANELNRRGYRVIVFANYGPFCKHLHPEIKFIRAFFEHGWIGVLYGIFQMIRISWMEKIKFIHVQKLESCRAAWIAKFITGVPVLKTAHGYTPQELLTVGKLINKYADRVVTVVDWLKEDMIKNGVERDKITVIYNGTAPFRPVSSVEVERLKRKLDLKKSDHVMVSVSRLEKGKNYAHLIEWFEEVLSVVPKAKLLIVGSGPEKQNLIQETSDLGLARHVIFIEGATDIRRYLKLGDVFCTPTVGRGMAVMEAMAAGLPVVGVEPIGNPTVVISGETGFIVPKDQGQQFAQKVEYLLKHPKVAKKMGAAGRKRVREKFQHTRMVDELVKVYEEFWE